MHLIRAGLEARPQLLKLGPAAVLYAVADAVVDGHLAVADTVEADVDESVAELVGLADELAPGISAEANAAKRLALWIGDRTPILWGAEGIGAVAAMRWKTQLNENAKVPAWCSSMSELDHNEVVGWSEGMGSGNVVIALRHDDDVA